MTHIVILAVAFLALVAGPAHAATLTITHGVAVNMLWSPDAIWDFGGDGWHDAGVYPVFDLGDVTINGQTWAAQCGPDDDCDGSKPVSSLFFFHDFSLGVGETVPFTAAGQYAVIDPAGQPVIFDLVGQGLATLQQHGSFPSDFDLIYTFTPAAVPEPTSLALLALGVGLAFSVSRRVTRR
jgi:hypothetical protein